MGVFGPGKQLHGPPSRIEPSLDPDHDQIIELCCFITDHNLNLLDEAGFEAVVHQPKEVMDAMNQWCIDHHGASGLTAAVLSSTVTAEAAAQGLLRYIKSFVPAPRCAVLAGNSVHADKAFLVREPYKQVVDWLHYRILDVSTFKEAARRWGSSGLLEAVPRKKYAHTAREDILESIEEMRYYRSRLFGRD
ncbi:hypothetical protein KEM52_001080 [Ascosphaera acerosa]|nr:hypothetical protein KEM52_001080 [Ascosphaera acerosa]